MIFIIFCLKWLEIIKLKPPNNQFEQFEQIIYRKQIDLKTGCQF